MVAIGGLVADAELAAGPGLLAGPGPFAATRPVDPGLVGAALAVGDATSYRYRSYCRIRPMSFVP
jgi:hypothetical protein